MGTMAGQLAVRCRPDPFCVAQNSGSARCGMEPEVRGGLEFPGGTHPARRAVGACMPFQVDTGIGVACLRPDLVSWLRLVREKATAHRGAPLGLDGNGPCAGLRPTSHRRV